MAFARPHEPQPYPILHLTSSSDIGGTERMVLELLSRIDRGRFEPIVLSLLGGGDLIRECRGRGIDAEPLRARFPLDWRAWRRFGRVVRERGVVLVHLYGLRANLPGRHLARKAGARVVVAGIRNIDPWRKWYHVSMDRWTSGWVNCFISNSEAGRQIALKREGFPPSRVVTIHSGIEEKPHADTFDRDALRRQFGIEPAAEPVIAVIANLRSQKGHRDLVDAVARLAGRWPNLRVLCAGHDFMDGANQRFADEHGVAAHFRWLGHVDKVEEVIAASDFAALPSSFEGLPASILEVLAMGRAVIAAPVGGVAEAVRDGVNGLLVSVGDVEALAAAIERLAADRALRARLEQGALDTIRNEFSIDHMVRETERLYLDLIEGRRS